MLHLWWYSWTEAIWKGWSASYPCIGISYGPQCHSSKSCDSPQTVHGNPFKPNLTSTVAPSKTLINFIKNLYLSLFPWYQIIIFFPTLCFPIRSAQLLCSQNLINYSLLILQYSLKTLFPSLSLQNWLICSHQSTQRWFIINLVRTKSGSLSIKFLSYLLSTF